jgi:hypothetical protein
MINTSDPSQVRDAVAKETATERSNESVLHGRELSDMVHRLKGELAANTSITKEIVTRQQEMHTRQMDQSKGLEDIRAATREIVELIKVKRAGGRWARAFSEFVSRCAKYWAPILTTVAALAAFMHSYWPDIFKHGGK